MLFYLLIVTTTITTVVATGTKGGGCCSVQTDRAGAFRVMTDDVRRERVMGKLFLICLGSNIVFVQRCHRGYG